MEVVAEGGAVGLGCGCVWSGAAGGSCPVDALVGVGEGAVTAGARCLLCTLGVVQDVKQAAADLHTVARLRVSPERLRLIVEAEGVRVMEARRTGALAPGWSAAEVDQVCAGVDGGMVRGVSDGEREKGEEALL